MRLLRMTLANFQGTAHREIEFPNDKNTEIVGPNRAGKSTLHNAFCWLLTGKDAKGRSDFQIKPTNNRGAIARTGDPTVEVVLDMEDGTAPRRFRKALIERWVNERRFGVVVFKGNATKCWIDDVPYEPEQFAAEIAKIASPVMLQILSNPLYFCSILPWEARRRILLEIVGDVGFQDVIDSNPALADLPGLLDGRDVEGYRKILVAQGRQLDDDLDEIGPRIDEAGKAIHEVLPDLVSLQEAVDAAEASLDAVNEEIAQATNGSYTGALKVKVLEAESELRGAIADARREAEERARKDDQCVQDEFRLQVESYNKAQQDIAACSTGIDLINKRISKLRATISSANADMAELNSKYQAVLGSEWPGPSVCYACNQILPEATVEANRQAWNQKRSEDLARIDAKGNEHRRLRDEAKSDLEIAELECASAQAKLNALKESAPPMPSRPAARKPLAMPDTAEIVAARARLNTAKTAYEAALSDAGATLAGLNARKTEANASLSEAMKLMASAERMHQSSNDAMKRCDELQQQRQEIGELLGENKRCRDLVKDYYNSLNRMLGERIHAHFNMVGWKLFDEHIEGDHTPCCEAVVDGIQFNYGLNTGSQILAGLECIDVIGNFYQLFLPVFIDNAETLTDIFVTMFQTIVLRAQYTADCGMVITHQ